MESSQLLEQAIGRHREGAVAEAEKRYLEILADDPGHADTRQMLGVLRMEQDRFEDALEQFDIILRSNPGAIQALMQKGFALRALGRKADALAHYDHILRMGPGFPRRSICGATCC